MHYLYSYLFNIKIKQYLFVTELHEQKNSTAFSTRLIAAHRNVHMRATKFNISAHLRVNYSSQHS